jgi:hypothetical protein
MSKRLMPRTGSSGHESSSVQPSPMADFALILVPCDTRAVHCGPFLEHEIYGLRLLIAPPLCAGCLRLSSSIAGHATHGGAPHYQDSLGLPFRCPVPVAILVLETGASTKSLFWTWSSVTWQNCNVMQHATVDGYLLVVLCTNIPVGAFACWAKSPLHCGLRVRTVFQEPMPETTTEYAMIVRCIPVY